MSHSRARLVQNYRSRDDVMIRMGSIRVLCEFASADQIAQAGRYEARFGDCTLRTTLTMLERLFDGALVRTHHSEEKSTEMTRDTIESNSHEHDRADSEKRKRFPSSYSLVRLVSDGEMHDSSHSCTG